MHKHNLESLINSRIELLTFINILKESGAFIFKCDLYSYLAYLLKVEYDIIPLKLNSTIFIDKKILDELNLLKKGYPLAYIIKSKYFFGNEFYIDQRALIPREDTNILVKKVIDLNEWESPSILDLCTGSGCIFISLLLEIKRASAIGIDKSLDALMVAQVNVHKFGLYNRSSLICADVFNIECLIKNKFDIITCNPPYVGIDDQYNRSILYEPLDALFPGDKKGIIFYKKLLPIINKLCRKGGLVVFEISPFIVKDIMEILMLNRIDAKIANDYNKYPRLVFWKNM